MRAALRAPTGEGTALRALVVLIAIVTFARLVLAAMLGLGVDEAYTVATSRVLALGTFDHPPMAWWLAGGTAKLFGSEAPLLVRLPFVVLGALSLAFAYDAGRYLYSARAGFYAAVVIALAPVLGWTSGSMVLPDGPLIAGLLAGLCCLVRALFGAVSTAPRWWLLAGAGAGFACLSKLHGIFLLAGAGLFLLTTPSHRHWLRSPWPYFAALVTLAVASPFLIWNAAHDWISFTFQAGRAGGQRFDPMGPLLALGGQALFLLPWVWAALMLSLARAGRYGPGRPRDWLLVCCAIGPIAGFTLVALAGTKTLFHWAAPGYLFACLLLGRDLVSDLDAGRRQSVLWLRGAVLGLAGLYAIILCLTVLPWPKMEFGGRSIPYPLIETSSWRAVRDALQARGVLGSDGLMPAGGFIAGVRWHEAGRLAVALGPAIPVICLCLDPRGFGMTSDNRNYLGHDGLIILPETSASVALESLAPYFAGLEPLEPVLLQQGSSTLARLVVYRGRSLRDPGAAASNVIHPFGRRGLEK